MHFNENGKTLFLRGVNLGDAKFPPGAPTYLRDSLNRAESCSYVGAPLPLDEAPQHLQKLRFLGFNVLRVPVLWEGLEHAGPGIYDDEYKLAKQTNSSTYAPTYYPPQAQETQQGLLNPQHSYPYTDEAHRFGSHA